LGLALDEPKDGDDKISLGKLTFLIEKNMTQIEKIKIDYRDSWMGKGFVVYSGGGNC